MFIQPGRLASLLQIARVGSWINDVHKIAIDTSQAGHPSRPHEDECMTRIIRDMSCHVDPRPFLVHAKKMS